MTFNWEAAWGVLSAGFGGLISFVVIVFVFGFVGALVKKNAPDLKILDTAAAFVAAFATMILISAVWVGLLR